MNLVDELDMFDHRRHLADLITEKCMEHVNRDMMLRTAASRWYMELSSCWDDVCAAQALLADPERYWTNAQRRVLNHQWGATLFYELLDQLPEKLRVPRSCETSPDTSQLGDVVRRAADSIRECLSGCAEPYKWSSRTEVSRAQVFVEIIDAELSQFPADSPALVRRVWALLTEWFVDPNEMAKLQFDVVTLVYMLRQLRRVVSVEIYGNSVLKILIAVEKSFFSKAYSTFLGSQTYREVPVGVRPNEKTSIALVSTTQTLCSKSKTWLISELAKESQSDEDLCLIVCCEAQETHVYVTQPLASLRRLKKKFFKTDQEKVFTSDLKAPPSPDLESFCQAHLESFLVAVTYLGLRYGSAYDPAGWKQSRGFHAALPKEIWALLKDEVHVEIEGFATPYEHDCDIYYSLHPDLDCVFGASGSFFGCASFPPNSYALNPPFSDNIIAAALGRIVAPLKADLPYSFILIAPDWTGAKFQSHLATLSTQGFIKAKIRVEPLQHTFVGCNALAFVDPLALSMPLGALKELQRRPFRSISPTLVLLIQNAPGSKLWPVDPLDLEAKVQHRWSQLAEAAAA